ncbi:LolA family protein [Pedobacter frigoris]|uniref:Outer membrane lipoprotein-sorting protein n=1 Tax=Pedobacter frigoris TaxID=2571272 RepID=A0A4U1CLQ0_9SPHI|nr:hypothetical protein [Pedobacter frigoris]TKC07476.1 hypothetical protein FA047_09525 [Pedobacter frigoris]
MLKKSLFFAALVALNLNTQAQTNILSKVIGRYGGKWPKTLSFTQTTTLFTPKGEVKQTWFEAGSLPNYFRIDFNREKGNTVIFDGDKEYYFKENKLTRTGKNNNPLIYLLGGMYFDSIDTVKNKLSKIGVDHTLESTNTWNGKNVLVVGTTKDDATKTQLWFDAKELYLVRFIQKEENSTLDVHFSGQQKLGNTWHETIVDVYKNNKMLQKEEYSEFKTNIKLDEAIFDPNQFGKVHWLN